MRKNWNSHPLMLGMPSGSQKVKQLLSLLHSLSITSQGTAEISAAETIPQ
jgi:hypothetical protein